MITLKNIHVTLSPGTVRERKALRGIDLSIKEGEFVTVIGSNGAGKSTLLNTIAGEILPHKGHIHIDDINVTFKESFQRSAYVARVFQDPLAGTCAGLTIAENLALAQRRGFSRGLSKAINKSMRENFSSILKKLDLKVENRLDTPMSMLSGGQRQAVSLLMATLSPLKILLLDEHTSALDPKTAAFVMKLTQKIVQEKGLTALMVTHSLQQALQVGTRTIMLHEGKLIYDISGSVRQKTTVQDLLQQFGAGADDDRLLLQ